MTGYNRQAGAALIIGLILISVMSILSVAVMRQSSIDQRVVGNVHDKQKALHAADSATRRMLNSIGSTGYTVADFVSNRNRPGRYDLRRSGFKAGAKRRVAWKTLRRAKNWPVGSGTAHVAMSNKIAGDDPMKLSRAPQFAAGMHDPVLRLGTSDFKCVPFTLLGYGTGSDSHSKSVIEMNVIPRSTCYRVKVK